ncbi:Muniscin C-terminal mu homology domain-containing protein [Elsinoe ampelina]|uniref:Muniscin C-terminal mu homology domain-containing protein n=1 Tax=Elsinoe ampelina TaxID=302913 RepID=A0A6A6FYN5_9PEZI|nr:Muniscin C-terminal mu homology domain-containing protein [Elsinoe ampelina]
MALDRQEYPAMLATLQPSEAVQILDSRVKLVSQINSGIADWLQERRRLEEQYSQGLRKLSRRPALADPQELGVFATPWSALVSALDTLADTHHNLAQKIEADVETPLRLFNSQHRDMTAMGNIQGNLQSLAKDIDGAQKKLDKLGQKGTVQKVAAASKDLDTAQAQWEAQAPFVFESLQALDENRLNHLRDVLTQFQTHEVDKVERNRIAAEQCLNVLLTVETADEIKTFAMRTSSGERPTTARRPQGIQQSASVSSLPPVTTPGPSDDRASQRSDSVSDLPTPKAEKPRGLRRLGTVLGRRRESKIPPGAGRIAESPERTPEKRPSRLPNSSTFSSFSRRSKDPAPTLEPPREDEAERPRSPLRTVSSRSDAERPQELPTTNGAVEAVIPNGSHQSDLAGLNLDTPRQLSEAPTATTDGEPEKMADKGKAPSLDPISAAEQQAAEGGGSEQGVPSFKVDIKDAPATQEAGDADALAAISTTLRMQAPSTVGGRRTNTVRGRRDNRASIYDSLPSVVPGQFTMPPAVPQAQGIPEEPASPIQTSAASVPISSPQPSAPVSLPSTTAFTPFSSAVPHSPLSAIRPASAQRDDAGSVRSGRSHTSTASASHRHPDLISPGLNTSIIETVSAWFENGTHTRSLVIGEVAVAYNNPIASSETEVIRLTHFDKLDKVAPNPAFLSNKSDEAGVYNLNLGQLGKGKQTAFKYQLNSAISEGGKLAPLILQPVWKIEAGQASVILSYSANPAFGTDDEILLKDVTLVLHLGEGTKSSSCLSKPVGTFSKERGVIYWTLGEVKLRKGETGKVLARFQTEGQAKVGKAEARWTFEGSGGSGVELERREEDPFSDGEGGIWKGLEEGKVRRRLVGGTYQGV